MKFITTATLISIVSISLHLQSYQVKAVPVGNEITAGLEMTPINPFAAQDSSDDIEQGKMEELRLPFIQQLDQNSNALLPIDEYQEESGVGRGEVQVVARPLVKADILVSTLGSTVPIFIAGIGMLLPAFFYCLLSLDEYNQCWKWTATHVFATVLPSLWAIIAAITFLGGSASEQYQLKYRKSNFAPRNVDDQTNGWMTTNRKEKHEWLIHLPDDAELKSLQLDLLNSVKWKVSMRENSNEPIESRILDSDVFQDINQHSLLLDMLRDRKTFVLRMETDGLILRISEKTLIKLSYEIPSDGTSARFQLKYVFEGKEHQMPDILVSKSDYFQQLRMEEGGQCSIVPLPDPLTKFDTQIMEKLAKYWEAADMTSVDGAINQESTKNKLRMLQLLDWLQLSDHQKFVSMCFAPSVNFPAEKMMIRSQLSKMGLKTYEDILGDLWFSNN